MVVLIIKENRTNSNLTDYDRYLSVNIQVKVGNDTGDDRETTFASPDIITIPMIPACMWYKFGQGTDFISLSTFGVRDSLTLSYTKTGQVSSKYTCRHSRTKEK